MKATTKAVTQQGLALSVKAKDKSKTLGAKT